MYFNRFTENAKKSIDLAMDSAKELGHDTLGSEHILLGLLREKNGVASRVLNKLGVTETIFKDKVVDFLGYGEAEDIEIIFSIRVRQILELALVFANKLKSIYVETEHILLATIQEGEGIGMSIILSLGIDETELVESIIDEMGLEGYTVVPRDSHNQSSKEENASTGKYPLLDKYGINLTELANNNELDPLIGRQVEIDRIIQILSRRSKNNPVLIGDPGVGKTSIVEGLAIKIANKEVPSNLLEKQIYILDIGAILAGAKYRGEFEERLKNIIEEVKGNKNLLVFIDEMHTIVGAGGSSEGAIDASNILKPSLTRGEIQIIGATTIDEYRKNIEKDSAFARRFQSVLVDEPTKEETVDIIKGLREKFENHHNVIITDEAIVSAINLSSRYINDRFLPDKAIDLIDEASAKTRLREVKKPEQIESLEEMLIKVMDKKIELVESNNLDKLELLEVEEDNIRNSIIDISEKWSKDKDIFAKIDKNTIAEVIEQFTGIPINKILEDEAKKLLNLEDVLHNRVVGQSDAVKSISKAIRRSRSGLKDPNRPIGSFLFLGPTGVGKTELSKALAEAQFGSEDNIVRMDMSEYMEKHSVSKMIGSPPGYVGYGEGGQLTEKVRRYPYSVILFDEIEKAHSDVFNILLQILDEGRLTDSKGRNVDFKNTIIIMTSNVGASEIKKQSTLGFQPTKIDKDKNDHENMKNKIMTSLKNKFRPEFINRIDDIIVFHHLSEEDIKEIARIIIEKTVKRLKEIEVNLIVTDEVLSFISQKGCDLEYGARPLKRAIQKELEDELAEYILANNIDKNSKYITKIKNEKITFEII